MTKRKPPVALVERRWVVVRPGGTMLFNIDDDTGLCRWKRDAQATARCYKGYKVKRVRVTVELL